MPDLQHDPQPDVPRDRRPANPHRTRDLILVLCSFAVAVAAVWYRGQGFALGLVMLSLALFWLAVLDSATSGPRRSRVMITVASAVLLGIVLMVILVLVLLLKPPVPRGGVVAPPAPPPSVSLPPPAPPAANP